MDDAVTVVLQVMMCLHHSPEGVMRSKRRCVLEKKQPYSGDEWCSGPDTEEDEDKPHTTAHRESVCLSACLHKGGNTLQFAPCTDAAQFSLTVLSLWPQLGRLHGLHAEIPPPCVFCESNRLKP